MLIHKSCTLFSLCVSQPEHNDWAPVHLMNEEKMTMMLLCCSGCAALKTSQQCYCGLQKCISGPNIALLRYSLLRSGCERLVSTTTCGAVHQH